LEDGVGGVDEDLFSRVKRDLNLGEKEKER